MSSDLMEKEWYKSKTVVSAVVFAAANVAQYFFPGYDWLNVVEMLAAAGVVIGFRSTQK